jgi:hypothetical protein
MGRTVKMALFARNRGGTGGSAGLKGRTVKMALFVRNAVSQVRWSKKMNGSTRIGFGLPLQLAKTPKGVQARECRNGFVRHSARYAQVLAPGR